MMDKTKPSPQSDYNNKTRHRSRSNNKCIRYYNTDMPAHFCIANVHFEAEFTYKNMYLILIAIIIELSNLIDRLNNVYI